MVLNVRSGQGHQEIRTKGANNVDIESRMKEERAATRHAREECIHDKKNVRNYQR